VTKLSADSIPLNYTKTSVSHNSKGKESTRHESVRSPASSRHSRAPSLSPSTASPGTTSHATSESEPDSPVDRLKAPRTHRFPFTVENIAFEDMDQLGSTMPKSPTRSGRSKNRKSRVSDRQGEVKLDWHGRELKEKLKKLQQFPANEQDEDADQQDDQYATATTIIPLQDISRTPSPSNRRRRISRSRKRTLDSVVPPLPMIAKTPEKTVIPSIDDIVRKYTTNYQSPSANTSRSSTIEPTSPSNADNDYSSPSTPIGLGLSSSLERSTRMSAPSALQHSRHRATASVSSVDSVVEEAMRALDKPSLEHNIHHARSMPSIQEPSDSASIRSSSSIPKSTASDQEISEFLRSPRLTRLITVNADRLSSATITLSLADVGSAAGHPCFVYLGLNCVRYLVALYDDLAEAMGLRLICIDRWGLGKSESVPKEKRGFMNWAYLVQQAADQLGIGAFSILAHSAGASYALATSLLCPERIKGRIHLLAPWVNGSLDGQATGYKLLKWVPNGMIRTAQAVEWVGCCFSFQGF